MTISTRVVFAILAAAVLASGCDTPAVDESGVARPNIVLLMSDDQGWGDVGYNGNAVLKTPHLDAMATEGVRLDRFYAAAPVCSPTRASVLTGRHPFRYGIKWAGQGHLPLAEETLAELLSESGYRTGHFGKWHVGELSREINQSYFPGDAADPAHYAPPWEQGFDESFSTESMMPTYNPYYHVGGEFGTDGYRLLQTEPVAEGQRTGGFRWRDFFWTGPGEKVDAWPVGDSSKVIMDRALTFIETSVGEDAPFAAVIWFHTPHSPLVAGDEDRAQYADQPMEAQHWYGSISAMDREIGRLRARLRELGVADDTLVWFTSDNGPSYVHAYNSAGPFKGKKGELSEGGVRVPGIVEWPAVIEGGRQLEAPMSTSDILPTVAAATGARLPEKTLDGIDVLPLLNGELEHRGSSIAFQSPVRGSGSGALDGQLQFALSGDRYKLYSGDNGATWQLYDLITDPGESQDVAADNVEQVGLMKAELDAWVEETRLDNQPARPNILVILADDLGFTDLGSYGSEIETPHLDALAAEGLRFSQFYNSARCVPTRASLLTGHYPHVTGLGHMNYDAGAPGYTGILSKETATIAEVLAVGGYRTHMAGKWHLTPKPGPESDSSSWPMQRGFDSFFGTLPGHGSFYDPAGLMQGNEFIEPGPGFFYTDAITDSAVSFIDDAAGGEQPFFMYVAYTAPHYPLHARQETIDKYDGVYDIGWDELRERRRARVAELGLVDVESITTDEASIPWDDEPNKEWQADRMQAFAAMVDEMDQGIGRILDALERRGIADNTLVVFLSDNGGSPEGHLNNTIERAERPWKSSVIPQKTRDGRDVIAGDFIGLAPGADDTYGSYGLRWASVSNTPFRRHKSWVHEGGIATPAIMRWPAGITGSGRVTNEVGHIIDLMPTFLDIAGVDYAAVGAAQSVHALPGHSLAPLFLGEKLPGRSLFWEHEGNRAVRRGQWKLVSEFPGTWSYFYSYPLQGGWELYDLSADRGEQHDLADQYPELVKALASEYEDWATANRVVQWDELAGRIE